jgi:hypothetical protein
MSKTDQAARKFSPPWDLLHHGLVGALLGFPLAVFLSGVLVYHVVDAAHDIAAYQVTMWIVPVLWAAVIGAAFLAPSKRVCWALLLVSNLVAWLLVRAVQA